jgi:hypothetical protein
MKPIKQLIHRLVTNENFWSILGILGASVASLIHYFSGNVDKACYWVLVNIFLIINLRD